MAKALLFISSIFLAPTVWAESEPKEAQTACTYSPCLGKAYPQNVYWGDTHVHTVLSLDASMWGGNYNLGPEEAYRFAMGEKIEAHNGMQAQLVRPLDFLVVADHAEWIGTIWRALHPDAEVLANDKLKRLSELALSGGMMSLAEIIDTWRGIHESAYDDASRRPPWDSIISAAEKYNNPGKFTAFIGYEWTSAPTGNNLHRNVIFADGADKAGQIMPFSAVDSDNPEDLWEFMANYEQSTGGRVLAIPHNANLSNGMMFQLTDFAGNPIDKDYAETRSRWEPLIEVTQIKGDAEANPFLSAKDEFADYETWDKLSMGGIPKEPWMLKHEYARSALKLGLQLEEQTGANPYDFGMIGSSDSHTSFAAVAENNYWGKVTSMEPKPNRAAGSLFDMTGIAKEDWTMMAYNKNFIASGYAAIWSTENTRTALFEAMQRKETYATTGPRMTVRFFGGWDYQPEDITRPDFVDIGYTKGVPMGGNLKAIPSNQAPTFMVSALKDPDGANLDRVQVIKGWLDSAGELHEKVYEVALSNGRKKGFGGKVRPVGNTVDINTATYTNIIGDVHLSAMWRDPDFEKDQAAFYYARVIEIPTPRWTTYDAALFDTELPEGVPATIQERAYTSPIWYSPEN